MKRLLTMTSIIMLLSGCSSSSKIVPVGIDEVVKGIESDIKELGYISVFDLLSDNPEGARSAELYIREKQCFYNNPNPVLVTALLSQLSFELKGVFTEEGGFKVSATPAPTGEISSGTSSETEQKVTLPVTVSSLSALPDLYLTARLKIITIGGLSEQNKGKLEKETLKNYDKLQQIIKQYQDSYSTQICPTVRS